MESFSREENFTVHSLFHRWVLVKPNDLADVCQLAENRRKFHQFLLEKFEIGAFFPTAACAATRQCLSYTNQCHKRYELNLYRNFTVPRKIKIRG
jgi:hypothetical protein